MCGISGVATCYGRELSIPEPVIRRMNGLIARRGPDDHGFWQNRHVALAHQRLAIQSPLDGDQPFHLGNPNTNDHLSISYNGEIYNHPQLRKQFEADGQPYQTDCDTETVARVFRKFGLPGLNRLRGMFAFAAYDARSKTLTLARDPLGIKPLYYALVQTPAGLEVAFASEPIAILDHPHISIQPDWITVSAYLTTIRTTLGHRSMFEGVHVVQPGHAVTIDLAGDEPKLKMTQWYDTPTHQNTTLSYEEAVERTAEVIAESTADHLLSDVPLCALLSGGLDSCITSLLAASQNPSLKTFCTGAGDPTDPESDLFHAKNVANFLDLEHHQSIISQGDFTELWQWMIGQLAVPLSTPNEVAIFVVASQLAEHAKVTLSGEGADELFAGYGPPLKKFSQYLDKPHDANGNPIPPSIAYLQSVTWVPPSLKPQILSPEVHRLIDRDTHLLEEVDLAFDQNHDPYSLDLSHFLRAQQNFNLTGLLGRLDTATMLAGVEGRTPFADIRVAEFANSLPIRYHYDGVRTKRLLRDAFKSYFPPETIERPKASFPLPFQSWLAEFTPSIAGVTVARDVFTPQTLHQIEHFGSTNWLTSWPVMNLTIWLETFWGSATRRNVA